MSTGADVAEFMSLKEPVSWGDVERLKDSGGKIGCSGADSRELANSGAGAGGRHQAFTLAGQSVVGAD